METFAGVGLVNDRAEKELGHAQQVVRGCFLVENFVFDEKIR